MWRQRLVLRLSGMLALLSALGLALSPHMLDAGNFWLSGVFLAVVWVGAMAVVVGFGCRFLDSVLECALRGGTETIEESNFDPGPALTSFVKWSLCFVAGPAFLIYEAFRFWIRCGDSTIGNGLILAELTVPAIGYWLAAVLVLTNSPDMVHPSPWQVLKAVRRVGLRAIPAGAAITTAGVVHVWLCASAIVVLYRSWLVGLFLLWIFWFSVLQTGAWSLRILGTWCSRGGVPSAQPRKFSAAA